MESGALFFLRGDLTKIALWSIIALYEIRVRAQAAHSQGKGS